MKHSKLITWLSVGLLGLAAAAFSPGMTAEAAIENGFEYTVDPQTNEATIKEYKGSATNLQIPTSLGGHRVTTIGQRAFAGESLTKLVVPSCVKEIEMYAFDRCTSMTDLTIQGNTKLRKMAFYGCTSLERVNLSAGSESADRWNYCFMNCPSLKTVNGEQAVLYQKDSNGRTYPVINPAIRTAVLNHFCRSRAVGFVDEYCQKICEYIVATETDPWMNDALKARQLHDWILRHCLYEDCENGESLKDSENHAGSSVFLSYAVNVRGEGVGESVCQGYSLAYKMLLAEAGIEAHVLYCPGHQWNLVKIDGKYYQADLSWESLKYQNDFNQNPYSTLYRYFLLSDEKMQEEHKTDESVLQYYDVTPQAALIGLYEHPLLSKYSASNDEIAALAARCMKSYRDKNKDGIMEYDFDLDGVFQDCVFKDQYDNPTELEMIVSMLRFSYGKAYTKEQMNQKLPEILSHLHEIHKSPYEYVRNAYFPITLGPVSVYRGGVAKFKCDVFGEGLTYQWKCCNSSSGQYENVNLPGSKTAALQFRAGLELNGKWFKCFVTNRDGEVLDGWGGQLLTVCDY